MKMSIARESASRLDLRILCLCMQLKTFNKVTTLLKVGGLEARASLTAYLRIE